MNEEFKTKMKLLIRSERALVNLEIQKRARQAVWTSLGLLSALISLAMLNIAIYFYFSETSTPSQAAMLLSILDALIAIVLFTISSRQKRSSEADSIEDIRDFAWEQISSDIDDVKQHVTHFKQNIDSVKSSVESFKESDIFGVKKFLPIITALIDLKKK